MYQWLCFDLDGVIFDYDRAEHEALSKTLQRFGYTLTAEGHALYRQVNRQLWTAWEQGQIEAIDLKTLRFERFLQLARIRASAEEFGRWYLDALSRAHGLWPGCRNTLRLLRARFRLAALTNGLQAVQRPRLRAAGLMPLFEAVVVSEEIGAAKPDRRFFEAAWTRLGRPRPEQVLMIGDQWEADITGAAAFGWHTCWFNPRNEPAPSQPPVRCVVRSWEELRRWLMTSRASD